MRNLLVTWRLFTRQWVYTLINVLGLSVGLACTLLILLFVLHERSFDQFHRDAPSLFRVTEQIWDERGNLVENSSSVPWPVGPTLAAAFPDLSVTRLYKAWQKTPLLTRREKHISFYEEALFFADTSFFRTFSFPLVSGDTQHPLRNPQSVVVTESAARRYFGDEDPVGKTVWLENSLPLTVTAVAEDPPTNSHIQFEFLVPLLNLRDIFTATGNTWGWEGWYWNPVHTYLVLPPHLSEQSLRQYLDKMVQDHFPQGIRNRSKLGLQPGKDIHFTTDLYQELSPNRSQGSISTAMAIGVFILLIACFNYVNLSTATAARRAKEIGIRKAVGSSKSAIALQVLSETTVLCLLSLVVAVGLMYLALPTFESLVNAKLNLRGLITPAFVVSTLSLTVLLGIVSGAYPAFFLANFRTVDVLKARTSTDAGGDLIRKSLIVCQFAISTILLIGASLIATQHEFLVSKSLGFEKEQVMVLPIQGTQVKGKIREFKARLNELPGVVAASAVSDVLGHDVPVRGFRVRGYDEVQNLAGLFTDADFAKTFGVEIIKGRNFSESASDTAREILINEEMLAFLQDKAWEGQPLDSDLRIIGVVKDFHFADLRQPVKPLIIGFRHTFLGYVAIRLGAQQGRSALTDIEAIWKEFEQERPFTAFFLDERLNNLYGNEKRTADLVGYFSALAIFIAILGLLGLVNYTLGLRRREISIRKVLGASVRSIVVVVSKQFLTLIVISNAFALPVAWYILDAWLSGFTYRVPLSISVFTFSGGAVLIIAAVVIVVRTATAAQTNPVDALKEDQ